MLPLQAELRTEARPEERGAARRILKLKVQTLASQGETKTVVRNLSERGLLIETTADLSVGETIQVDMPEAGLSPAKVIWTDGSFFGCQFTAPVSRAAVSAALLLAPPDEAQPLSALPYVPPYASHASEQAQAELEPVIESPAIGAVLMASLILLLVSVALFIFALLALPISG